MRDFRWLPLVGLLLLAGCKLFGGAEGHYTIDRELTASAIERYAKQELTSVVVQTRGKNAQVSEEELKRMEEYTHSMVDKMALDLNLEPGGKFHGSATIEGKTDTSEGTWILRGETVELTESIENGKPREKIKTEVFHYAEGLLSFADAKENPPFIILSRH